MPRAKTDGKPDPIDVEVGRRVCDLRQKRGLNQSDLGRALGLTFQQVQKYEKGANRVSASKLVGIARALQVAPSYFLDDQAATDFEAVPSSPVLPNRLRKALTGMPAKHLMTLADVAEAMTPGA